MKSSDEIFRSSHLISVQIDAVNAFAISVVDGLELETSRSDLSVIARSVITQLLNLVIMVDEACVGTEIGSVIIRIITRVVIIRVLILLVNHADGSYSDIDLARLS